jgi:hypothetical protein
MVEDVERPSKDAVRIEDSVTVWENQGVELSVACEVNTARHEITNDV